MENQRWFVWLRDPEGKATQGQLIGEDVPDLVAWGMIGAIRKPDALWSAMAGQGNDKASKDYWRMGGSNRNCAEPLVLF